MTLLYREIAEKVLSEFEAVDWRDGAPLPSESQLQKAFRISRTTVRHALACLEADGRIQRKRGSGSFYRSNKMGNLISARVGFHETVKTSGHHPLTRVHSLETRDANLAELAVFGPKARGGVVELQRLRLLDGQPIAYQTSILCHPGVSALQRSDLENVSLYGLLRNRFGIVVTKVSSKLEAINAPANIAGVLGIEPKTAIFNSRRMVEDQNGSYIELCNNYLRSDNSYFFFSDSADEFG